MEKVCAKCGLQFDCGADTPDCWCRTVAAWQPVRESVLEQYADCLCKTCLSNDAYPSQCLGNRPERALLTGQSRTLPGPVRTSATLVHTAG